MNLCIKEDDFVYEKPRWVAVLSDGTTVYQDDNRPGIEPASAWIRLGSYLKETELKIDRFRLQFRSNVVNLPHKASAYFFCRGALKNSSWSETYELFIVGTLSEGIFELRKYKIPELVIVEEETRSLEKASPLCVIRNYG